MFLSKHAIPPMNVMLNFMCMDSVKLQELRSKQTLQNKSNIIDKFDLKLTTFWLRGQRLIH